MRIRRADDVSHVADDGDDDDDDCEEDEDEGCGGGTFPRIERPGFVGRFRGYVEEGDFFRHVDEVGDLGCKPDFEVLKD